MSVTVRSARPDEYDRVGDLVVAAYATLSDGVEAYEPVLRDVARRAETTEVLVATLDGEVVGTATFVPGPGPQAEFDDPERRPSGCSVSIRLRAGKASEPRSSRSA